MHYLIAWHQTSFEVLSLMNSSSDFCLVTADDLRSSSGQSSPKNERFTHPVLFQTRDFIVWSRKVDIQQKVHADLDHTVKKDSSKTSSVIKVIHTVVKHHIFAETIFNDFLMNRK